MKALLIHHRKAGGGSVSIGDLAGMIRKAGWKVRCLPVKRADAKAIEARKAGLIVVAGGDGTVAKTLRMLPDRSLPVALIPTGTANNIAASLDIEGEPATIVAAWHLQRRRRVDIGQVEGPWGCRQFAEGVGFGAFADSLRRAEDLDGDAKIKAGRDAFDAALTEARPLPVRVSVDGRRVAEGALLVEVMNVPLTGPRLALAPDAEPGDGKLHLSWLRESRRKAMREWLEAAEGRPPVDQASGQEVRILGGGTMMRIDDECCWLEPDSDVTIRLEGEPVQILAPADAPALAG